MSKQELLEYLIDLSYKTRRLINLIKRQKLYQELLYQEFIN